MKTFSESSLQFQFADRWKALHFDQHRFYRYLSGQGLKGVDFLAVDWLEEELLLMEVKNFDPGDWAGDSPTMQLVLEAPEEYAQKIMEKFADSLRLCQIIYDYYQRKWWYPVFGKFLLKSLPTDNFLFFDFLFWSRLYYLIHSPQKQIRLVLFLEWKTAIDVQKIERFNQLLTQKIKTHFPNEGFSFRITSLDQPYPGILVKDFHQQINS